MSDHVVSHCVLKCYILVYTCYNTLIWTTYVSYRHLFPRERVWSGFGCTKHQVTTMKC